MRSSGGASVGLLICLMGCWPMPPPDPGRPPPPPETPAPATPPEPRPMATTETAPARPAPPPAQPGNGPGKTAAKQAAKKAAAPPTPEPRLVWDTGARTLRCGDRVAIPIPADLAVYVRTNGGSEVIVAPAGSPPGGAMIAMTIGEQMTASLSLDEPQFARRWAAMMERLERTGADLREALLRLTAIASGRRIKVGDYGGDVRTDDSGIVDLVFTDNQTPDTIWRLVAVHAATCVFLGIEHVRPDAAQRFFPMLARMCASNPSELKGCRESSSSFVLRKEETP